MEKRVSHDGDEWFDSLEVPAGTTVYWNITVKNDGNVPVDWISYTDLFDDASISIACDEGSLPDLLGVGESGSCIFNMTVLEGTHGNNVTVSGCLGGAELCDTSSDEANYTGVKRLAEVTIDKVTEWNGQSGDGLIIPVGESITWNYTVENTGNTVLNQIAVTDDLLGSITCPRQELGPGEFMVCTAEGTAVAGYYENTGTIAAHVPGETEDITDYDISFYNGQIPGTAIVRGMAFNDTDGDGQHDAGEEGIPGIEVTYTHSSTSVTSITDADGNYLFINLPMDEDFSITASLPAGFFRTTSGNVFSTTSIPEQTIDFGYALENSDFGVVYGTVFKDSNHDGSRNMGEYGLPGVTVKLTTHSSLVDTNLTNGYGQYTLRTDADGTYNVSETNPAGYVSTTPDTVKVDLTVGTAGPSPIDFGDFYGAKISGMVFNDTNENGIYDEEPGLATAIVSGGGETDTTEADGLFALFISASGEVTVTETNPSGYVSTNSTPGMGATWVDADTLHIAVSSGEEYGGNYFGDWI
ncbi:MAG TPA: SdrD B-like domain-containing protein, partial [Methanomicrobiales archaeon]|nr:SdrD B-like domain-containing protein [Methanomicrobiales archaeon]